MRPAAEASNPGRAASAGANVWLVSMPWLFVLIWSTGFIVAKYGMPHAEPMTFLFLRFAGVVVLMVPFVVLARVPLPRHGGRIDWPMIGRIALAGLLLQTGYLGGVWAAVKLGMPAGMAALIVGMQPLLTALISLRLGERLRGWQWLGLLLGIVGVGLVVAGKLSAGAATPFSVLLAVGALLSITVGTLYQKHRCPVFDLRMGSLIQFTAAALACLPWMFLFETREVDWNLEMIGALAWSIVALSIGAISLLFVLIRRGAATSVSSLMYLTPPTTAVMAWLLFDERFPPMAAAGMALAAAGVALVMRGAAAPSRRA
ncbi:DMT family transporter [Cupriavidus gilardii]|uniref:DMT family transporter n=1 Tax=Cupriavidus gilardii TaxID=82541 RepID=A0A6N1BRA0_9BURK|nr:DMT family transporter [Cupriavidus gilardii]KAB0597709.1 DMT family transporter [Cupriavidus gilardii]MCT9011997.1 DMT family transporter [Cupriavidus gilardii]MCT9053866.1 DMT family transporter [Cupriavidus gilardii]MCT9071681.1 DMT family transporter [Cupriavidus gilardii]MCT9118709.1 DMT family transporter [Cupriavidus gilardii]